MNHPSIPLLYLALTAVTAITSLSAATSVTSRTAATSATSARSAQAACPSVCACGQLEDGAWCELGGGNSVNVHSDWGWWEVKCNDGDISCDTFPQFSFGRNSSIDLKLTYCSLSSLSCLPRRLQAATVARLQLHAVKGTAVTEDMLRDMDLDSFFYYGEQDPISELTFPREALSRQPNLRRLTINQAVLTLSRGDFDTLPRLESIELTSTQLETLPKGIFEKNLHLQSVILWGNEFEELPEGIFDGLSNLRVLSLESNRLRSISFVALSPSLSHLTNLTLTDNQLEEIPKLDKLQSLTQLKLDSQRGSTPLRVHPSAFSPLPHLIYLSCSNARLHTISSDVFRGSTALEVIDLSGNMIEVLPEGIFTDQVNLRKLILDSNRLTSLPAGRFDSLTKLHTISIADNKIEQLDIGALSPLLSLQTADLSRNMLYNIAAGALPRNLKEVILDDNRISFGGDTESADYSYENLLWSPFNGLTSLEVLSMRNNRLNRMIIDIGHVNTRLRRFDLSYNNITLLEDSDVTFVSNNVTVDLRHNKISNVLLREDAPFQPLGRLTDTDLYRVMLLDDNPFDCDCYLYYFAKRLKGYKSLASEAIFDVGDAKCSNPPSLKGLKVKSLSLEDFICQIDEKPDCDTDCECQYMPHNNSIQLNCLREPKKYPATNESNITYDLKLREIPKSIALKLPNVRKLNLSGLAMDEIPNGDIPKSVKLIDLSNNNLNFIPNSLLEKNLSLLLSKNKFKCDCWHKNDISTLQDKSYKIQDWDNVVCEDNVKVRMLNPGQLCSAWLAAGVGGTLALIGIIIAVIATVFYLYSLEIKVWLYSRGFWFVHEEEIDKGKKYDAFISFCHKDEQFVIQNLLPGLENGVEKYSICVHYRDWIPGEWIPAQIASSVDASRRTIIVVSRNFLDSLWGRLEFRAANMHAVQERKTRAIVVLLEDISSHKELDPELKAYLSTNTYLKWGDPWFWDKLRYAMPHKGVVRDRNARKAEAKARKTGQKLAKQLAGAIDTQLTKDGVIINAAKLDVKDNDMEVALPKAELAKPNSASAKQKPNYGIIKNDANLDVTKDTDMKVAKPNSVSAKRKPNFDIPRLPTDVVANLESGDFAATSARRDRDTTRPTELKDVVPRGRKLIA